MVFMMLALQLMSKTINCALILLIHPILACTGDLLVQVHAHSWKSGLFLTLPPDCKLYSDDYNLRQKQIRQISVMDELLSGTTVLSI